MAAGARRCSSELACPAAQLARLVGQLQQVIRAERRAWGLGRGELPPAMAASQTASAPPTELSDTRPLT